MKDIKGNNLSLKALEARLNAIESTATLASRANHLTQRDKTGILSRILRKISSPFNYLFTTIIINLHKIPFISKIITAASFWFANSLWWKALVTARKIFVLLNAAIGFFLVLDTVNWSPANIFIGLSCFGVSYAEGLVFIAEKLFSWIHKFFDWLTPEPPTTRGGWWRWPWSIFNNSDNPTAPSDGWKWGEVLKGYKHAPEDLDLPVLERMKRHADAVARSKARVAELESIIYDRPVASPSVIESHSSSGSLRGWFDWLGPWFGIPAVVWYPCLLAVTVGSVYLGYQAYHNLLWPFPANVDTTNTGAVAGPAVFDLNEEPNSMITLIDGDGGVDQAVPGLVSRVYGAGVRTLSYLDPRTYFPSVA